MTPLDDLFSTDESRAEAQLEKVVTLNPADISDFPNHPFKVKQDEAMVEMVDSVKLYGVLAPALVRPKADGGYEMVAGHRRKCAATLAGITEMPCIVRNLTDDEARNDLAVRKGIRLQDEAGSHETARAKVRFNFDPTGAEVKG